MRVRTCTRCGETKPLDQFPPVRRSKPEKLQTWCRGCFAEANNKNYWKNHEREKARLLLQTTRKREDNRRRAIEYLLSHPCVDCGEKDIVVLQFDHMRDKAFNVSTMIANGTSWLRIEAEIAKCVVRCANCHRLKTAQSWTPLEIFSNGDDQRAPLARVPPTQLLLAAAYERRVCRVCAEVKPLTDFPFRSLAQQTRQWICLACQRTYTRAWYGRNQQRHIANTAKSKIKSRKRTRAKVQAFRIACVDCGETNPVLLDFDHLRDKRANVSQLVQSGLSWSRIKAEIDKCVIRCANCHARKTASEQGSYRLEA